MFQLIFGHVIKAVNKSTVSQLCYTDTEIPMLLIRWDISINQLCLAYQKLNC